MGYTHYFNIVPINGKAVEQEKQYKKAILECQTVVRSINETVCPIAGYAAHTEPGTYGGLNINGKGDDGHENFVMREHFKENGREFCKTARKPYDLAVVACLAILKHRLGKGFEVSSDGYAEDWKRGVAYASFKLGIKIKNPLPTKDESFAKRGIK